MRRSSRWRASYDATLLVDVHLMAERLHFLRHIFVNCLVVKVVQGSS
jgi:hypothetical protein